jgi:hypothetical protein
VLLVQSVLGFLWACVIRKLCQQLASGASWHQHSCDCCLHVSIRIDQSTSCTCMSFVTCLVLRLLLPSCAAQCPCSPSCNPQQTANIPAADLLYVNYNNLVEGLLPYSVALDAARRCVVVAIRGSLSVEDCVTGVCGGPMCVKDHEVIHSTKAGTPTTTGVGACKLVCAPRVGWVRRGSCPTRRINQPRGKGHTQ